MHDDDTPHTPERGQDTDTVNLSALSSDGSASGMARKGAGSRGTGPVLRVIQGTPAAERQPSDPASPRLSIPSREETQLEQLAQREMKVVMSLLASRSTSTPGAHYVPYHVFNQRIQEVAGLVHRFRVSVCVVVFGPLKSIGINDTSQMESDTETLARFLCAQSRGGDLVCRLEGHRVAIALFNETHFGGERLANRILSNWTKQVPLGSRLTDLAGGLSFLFEESVSTDQLIREADEARRSCYYQPPLRIRAYERRVIVLPERGLEYLRSLYPELSGPISRPLNPLKTMLNAISQANHQLSLEESERVAVAAVMLARAMKLSLDEQADLVIAALARDMGMSRMPGVIFSAGELKEIHRPLLHLHPEQSVQLLHDIPVPNQVPLIVRSHHERFDGTGYPRRLMKDQFSLPAQVLSMADMAVAMTRRRSHRAPLPPAFILATLAEASSRQFSPLLVDQALALPELRTELETIYQQEMRSLP